MSGPSPTFAASSTPDRALLWLCAAEAGLAAAIFGWLKAGAPATILPAGRAGFLFFAGVALVLVAVVMLVRLHRHSDGPGRRAFLLGVAGNFVTVAVALAVAEGALRIVAVETGQGLAVGRVVLPPTWNETRARNSRILATTSGFREKWLDYVIGDPVLGWTVGPNRRTPDGMYFSSVEGLRSGTPDVNYAGRRPALRIALVGDSFTFGMDGPFEDSWGYLLEQQLGSDVQVLNFGVDGYGVDQSWLRYLRDVPQWHPDIVLFGLIRHDVVRTVAVYPFLSFHWDYPFAKPRFALVGDELRLLNTPLVGPGEILARNDPGELPFANYDLGYQAGDWRWRRGNPPLLVRLLGAATLRSPAATPEVSDDAAIAISGHVLRSFMARSAAEGSASRILYFPSGDGDFDPGVPVVGHLARRMLAISAPGHLDLTECLRALPPQERLIPGRVHYTRRANGKVAECVAADLAARGWLQRIGGPGASVH